MDLKQIDRNIGRIRNNGKAWNELVQTTLIAIMRHAKEHGDCTRALSIVLALPENFKLRGRVVEYFREYTPIGMDVKKNRVHIRKDQNAPKWNIEGAEANPFYIVQEADKEPAPLSTLGDLKDAMLKLADKYAKGIEKKTVANDDVEAVTKRVAALRQLAAVA